MQGGVCALRRCYFDDAEPADAATPVVRDISVGISEEVIEARPSSNSAPAFPDEDEDGTDADPVMIDEEKENKTVGPSARKR